MKIYIFLSAKIKGQLTFNFDEGTSRGSSDETGKSSLSDEINFQWLLEEWSSWFKAWFVDIGKSFKS